MSSICCNWGQRPEEQEQSGLGWRHNNSSSPHPCEPSMLLPPKPAHPGPSQKGMPSYQPWSCRCLKSAPRTAPPPQPGYRRVVPRAHLPTPTCPDPSLLLLESQSLLAWSSTPRRVFPKHCSQLGCLYAYRHPSSTSTASEPPPPSATPKSQGYGFTKEILLFHQHKHLGN